MIVDTIANKVVATDVAAKAEFGDDDGDGGNFGLETTGLVLVITVMQFRI